MMKKVCCLMAVLALTGTASAVNILWNRDAETSHSLTQPSGSFSVALLVNVVSLSGTNNTTMVTLGNFTDTRIMAYNANDGLGVKHSGWWGSANASTVSGQHSVVLNFTKQTSGAYKIVVFVDGVQDSRTGNTHDTALTPNSDTMTITFVEDSSKWDYQGFAVYDDVLTTDQMNTLQSTRDVKSIVPEPSFLALLALGAGALALRRKAKCA